MIPRTRVSANLATGAHVFEAYQALSAAEKNEFRKRMGGLPRLAEEGPHMGTVEYETRYVDVGGGRQELRRVPRNF